MNAFQHGFFDELAKLASHDPYGLQAYLNRPAPAAQPVQQPMVQQPVQQPMPAGINASQFNRDRVGLRRSARAWANTARDTRRSALRSGIVGGAFGGFNQGSMLAGLKAGAGAAIAHTATNLYDPTLRVLRDAGTVAHGGLAEGGRAIGARVQSGLQGARAGMANSSNIFGRAAGAVTGFGRGLFKRAALRRHLMRKLAAMDSAGDAMSSVKKRLYNPIKAVGLGAHLTKKHMRNVRALNPNMPDKAVRTLASRSASDYMSKLRQRFPL